MQFALMLRLVPYNINIKLNLCIYQEILQKLVSMTYFILKSVSQGGQQ